MRAGIAKSTLAQPTERGCALQGADIDKVLMHSTGSAQHGPTPECQTAQNATKMQDFHKNSDSQKKFTEVYKHILKPFGKPSSRAQALTRCQRHRRSTRCQKQAKSCLSSSRLKRVSRTHGKARSCQYFCTCQRLYVISVISIQISIQ